MKKKSKLTRFTEAVQQNDVETARNLFRFLNVDQAFQIACSGGNLDFVKWIYTFGPDIHADEDNAFTYACEYGHKDIAEWLLGLDVQSIDIENLDWSPFRLACENDHLEVAQWLYELSGQSDDCVHSLDNYAFKMACENGSRETALWLYHLGCHIQDLEYRQKRIFLSWLKEEERKE